MAEPDFDYQFTGLRSQVAAAPDLLRRQGLRLAALPVDRTRWMLRGACLGEDPELFFPISGSGSAGAKIRAAKAICAQCPVRANCLSYALSTQPDGSWGGTTREERWRDAPSARDLLAGS